MLKASKTRERDLAGDVSDGSKDFNSNPVRRHPCDILANDMSVFCSCPKNLSETKLKVNGQHPCEHII